MELCGEVSSTAVVVLQNSSGLQLLDCFRSTSEFSKEIICALLDLSAPKAGLRRNKGRKYSRGTGTSTVSSCFYTPARSG